MIKTSSSTISKIRTDFIGLDTCLAIMKVLHKDMNDDKYMPCPLLEKMVSDGKFGRKSGEGFYKY